LIDPGIESTLSLLAFGVPVMPLTTIAAWCLGVSLLLIGLALVTALTRPRTWNADQTAEPMTGQVIAHWAEQAGYDLLSVSDEAPADDRVAAAFGYSRWDRPSQVCRVRLKDRQDNVHNAWVLMAGHDDGGQFTPDFIEVAWDDRSAEHDQVGTSLAYRN
jgi:hypothetical protein